MFSLRKGGSFVVMEFFFFFFFLFLFWALSFGSISLLLEVLGWVDVTWCCSDIH